MILRPFYRCGSKSSQPDRQRTLSEYYVHCDRWDVVAQNPFIVLHSPGRARQGRRPYPNCLSYKTLSRDACPVAKACVAEVWTGSV